MMIPKFRAWDKDSKVMREIQHLVWAEDNLIAHCPPRGHEFSEFFTVILNGWEYQLMQSTGLKEKNGVEIFEGDIVNVLGTIEGLEDDLGVVRFVDAAFVIDYDNLKSEFDYFNTVSLSVKVIGNIYENPELLEEE